MKRSGLTVCAAASGFPLAIYLLTRSTTWALDSIYTIDSAEMVLAAFTLGIDHPPGHPLYLILAHLFSLLPLTRPDEGVILTSVFAASVAAGLFALAIRYRTGDLSAALVTAWSFAFGQVVWFHATLAEVYTVQLACVAAFYAMAAGWLQTRRVSHFLALCFSAGLTASTNVLLAVLLVPGLLYLTWRSGLFQHWRILLAGLTTLILGATPLLYIPIRLGGDGFISDFVYLNGFEVGSWRWYLWYFSAEEFTATRIIPPSVMQYPGLALAYLTTFVENHSPIVATLAAVGLVSLFRTKANTEASPDSWRSRLTQLPGPQPVLFERTVLIGFLATLLPVLPYQVADREVFFMPSFAHLSLIAGYGAWKIFESVRSATFPDPAKPLIVWSFPPLVVALLVASHYTPVSTITLDQTTYRERESRFRSLPDSAIVTSTDDGRATRWKYWQRVIGLRPDVKIETLGRLAPRYQPGRSGSEASGAATDLARSLNVTDRLRVLKGIRAAHPHQPLYTILDDRLPTELDHFQVRRAPFDPRLLRLRDKPAPETSRTEWTVTIPTSKDSFQEIDVIGIDLTSLDNGVSQAFAQSVPIENHVVDGIIRRGEFFEIAIVSQKRSPGQYFAELAFVDRQMRIPSANGFTAARTLEIAPLDLTPGHYSRDRLSLKIPGFIPSGLYTLALSVNAVTTEAGTYRGRTVKRMVAAEARTAWAGQKQYQPLATIWVE